MASDPTARFQNVRELLAALSSIAPRGVNTLRSDRPPVHGNARTLDPSTLSPAKQPFTPPAPLARTAPAAGELAVPTQATEPAAAVESIATPSVETPRVETPRADPKPRVPRPDRERPKRVITELDY